MTPKNYGVFDEIERLKKMSDHSGLSKHMEELLRTSKEHDELIRNLAQPLSERMHELTRSLRTPFHELCPVEDLRDSYESIVSANSAIADMLEQKQFIYDIATRHRQELAAIESPAFSELTRMSQYSAIGEITLAAEKAICGINWKDMSSILSMTSDRIMMVEDSFRTFLDSYSELYQSINESNVDISSLAWFVTELPPVQVYTEADLARALSRTSPVDSEIVIPLEEDFSDETEESLEAELAKIDPGLLDALRGAKLALKSNNPDRSRHVTVSLRELITYTLHRIAPDEKVLQWSPEPTHVHNGKPTRAARLHYVCRSVNNGPFTKFMEQDVKSHLSFIDVFHQGTHGLNTAFTDKQMELLIVRTEALLRFMLTVEKDN